MLHVFEMMWNHNDQADSSQAESKYDRQIQTYYTHCGT